MEGSSGDLITPMECAGRHLVSTMKRTCGDLVAAMEGSSGDLISAMECTCGDLIAAVEYTLGNAITSEPGFLLHPYHLSSSAPPLRECAFFTHYREREWYWVYTV